MKQRMMFSAVSDTVRRQKNKYVLPTMEHTSKKNTKEFSTGKKFRYQVRHKPFFSFLKSLCRSISTLNQRNAFVMKLDINCVLLTW